MKSVLRQTITTVIARNTALLVLLTCLNLKALATIVTTAASSTVCTNYASAGSAPLWTSLGTISLRETTGHDMGGSGIWSATITIAAPTGWQFNSAVNPVLAYTAAKNVTSVVRGTFTSTSLTITINGNNKNKKDKVTITGLQVQPTTTSPVLSYVRPSSVTGTITGVSTSTTFAKLTPLSPVAGTAGVIVAVSPSAAICSGTSVTFSSSVTNGGTTPAYQWKLNGSNISGATSATYTSSALTNGSAVSLSVISYSCIATPTAASAATIMTVSPVATAISGATTVCTGATTTFTNAGMGTWSSSNIDIASVDMATGAVSGVTAGTATITFTTTGGCTATKAITVNAAPGTITGTMTLCASATSTLASTGTATWGSSAPAIATVSTTGIVTGVAAGTANINRTAANGCVVTATVTVNATPAAIGGTASVCAGSSTTLTNTLTGGVWTSSNAATATVSSGVVSGVAAGTSVVSYTMSTGCAKSVIVTVNAVPAVIGGASLVCKSSTTTLTQASAGGTWTSGTPTVATIGVSGIVSGVAQGTTMISYSFSTGCRATKVVSVTLAPAAISGVSLVCSGSSIALSNTSLYGTWTSSNAAVATVSATGTVTGGSNGTSTISYTTGCGTVVSKAVTVNNSPITGTYTVCTGYTTTLADVSAGGAWSSSNTSIATVSGGVVSGIAGGTATISYVNGSCTSTAVVTVNIAPAVITGSTVICQGSSTTLFNTTPYGSWSSNNNSIATVEAASGVVTGVTEGMTVITYNTGCGTSSSTTVTINVLPDEIGGVSPVCVGSSINLTSSGSGTWTSSNTSVATVDAAGMVSGVASGTSNITYTLSTGCSANGTVTVNALPATISGATSICAGATSTLTSGTGGTWTSSNPSVATIGSANGAVIAVAEGTTTISYTLSTGCGRAVIVTVNALPAAITGTFTACPATTTTLSSTAGGTWISSVSGVATVNSSTGMVTGVAAGTSNITYTLPTGCKATKQITVNPLPATITGTTSACTGATTNLADATAGGTWSSCNTAVATIGSTGIVSGVTPGTVIMRYILPTGCKTTTTVTINTAPSAGAIYGASSVCIDDVVNLTSTVSGGTWSVSDANIVDMDAATGEAFGMAAGTVTVTYTVSNVCATSYTTSTFTVSEFPTVNATTGASTLCAAATTTLANTTTGGVWSSLDATIAAVDAAGVVAGVNAGSTTISYTITNACGSIDATKTITVNPLPSVAAITGTASVCPDATTALNNAIAGGAWNSSNNVVATVTGGAVTGVTAGTSTISYVVTNSCGSAMATQVITVNALPDAGTITGPTAVCVAATTSLNSTVAGGVWSISDASVATVSGGIVTGAAPGTATVSYSVSNSCGTALTTVNVTVEAAPAPITGQHYVVIGGVSTLSNAIAGGIWTSSNASIASIDAAGVVAGIASGAVVMTYSLTNACGTNAITRSMAVGILGTWIGGSSANWNDAANWFAGIVPNDTISVSVATGTTYAPAISAAATVKNVTVASGATLVISANTLNVKGHLCNQSVISGNGVIVMNGNTPQTISGNGKICNLTIANNTSVATTADDTLAITGTLLLNAGTLTTNGRVMLVSTAAATGRIGAITGGSIAGNVTVQQYLPGRRAWRMMGHPFSTSQPLSTLTSAIDVTGTGGATNGFTTIGTNDASCFWFNPYTSGGVFNSSTDAGWQPFTSAYGTTDANLVKQYQAVRIFIRGARGEGLTTTSYTPSATTYRMAGQVNTGNQTVVMHKGTAVAASTGLSTQDFNLLSNPYPSPVDIGTVLKNAYDAGLIRGAAFYIWNPYLGTSGQSVTVPIDGTPYYLPANAAFIVRVNNDNTALNFTEANKVATTTTALLKAKSDYLTLNIYDESYHQWDALNVQFNEKATNGEDTHDAGKMADMADLNFYSLSDKNAPLAIDARPFAAGKTIPLGIKSNYSQDFIIRAENLAVPAGSRVVLHDKFLGKRTQLQQGTEYRFEITADEKSQGEKRFELIMDPSEVNETVVTAAKMEMSVSPNPATENVTVTYTTSGNAEVSATITSISGETMAEQQLGSNKAGAASFNIKSLPAGIYIVTVVSGNEKMVKQLVKQ